MGFFDELIDRPRGRRTVSALIGRIEEAMGHADLRHYDGYERAMGVPGTFASRFVRIGEELESLRLRAQGLAATIDRSGTNREATAELARLQAEFEPIETLTLAAVTFRHAQLALDHAFIGRTYGGAADAQSNDQPSLYSTNREHTFCDLNERFIALEQSFWSQAAAQATDLGARLELESRALTLRSECRYFLTAAPSPCLALDLRRYLDCAGDVVRETPEQRNPLGVWIADAIDAVAAWDEAMAQPFGHERVLDAYARLESLSLYPQTSGLAHAVAFESDPPAVAGAWRDHIVESQVGKETLRLYRDAVEAQRWATAAYLYGMALTSQKRVTEHVRSYDLMAGGASRR